MGYIPSLYTASQALLSVLVLGVASTAGLLYRYQRSLVYPSNFPAGSRTEVLTPDHFGIPYEDIRLKTPDGEDLHAFLMPQKNISEKEKARGEDEDEEMTIKRRPTVLFLHANAGNMGHRLPLASVFYKRFGCNVFMLSYRGYGLSTGQPSEQGIRIDAQTALDWLRKHRVLKNTIIVAYGQSIGGAVAVDLASRNGRSIHSIILENTFLSIPELIPHVLPPVRPFAFLCREYWPTGESIKVIPSKTPVLFLSGRMDELVPPSHMDALFERCRSENKVWKGLADGTHNDTCIKHGYFESIGLFMSTFVIPLTTGGVAAAAAAVAASPSLTEDFVLERDEATKSSRIIETGGGAASVLSSGATTPTRRTPRERSASLGSIASNSSSGSRRRRAQKAAGAGMGVGIVPEKTSEDEWVAVDGETIEKR